jgi:hypothetical protein
VQWDGHFVVSMASVDNRDHQHLRQDRVWSGIQSAECGHSFHKKCDPDDGGIATIISGLSLSFGKRECGHLHVLLEVVVRWNVCLYIYIYIYIYIYGARGGVVVKALR